MATMKSWRGEIAELSDLSRNDLGKCWTEIYRAAPPKGARRVLLERQSPGMPRPARRTD